MPRTPGRPRSPAADEAILQAAIDVFAEVGLEALTVEGVATRAGVGKGTIYRRYPNKIDLVVDAVRRYTKVGEAPLDTGTTRGDVRAMIDWSIAIYTETPVGRMIPIMVAARSRVPALEAEFREITAERRAASAIIVRRGIDRGDFRPEVDIDVVVDSFMGAVFYRYFVSRLPLDESFRAQVVDATFRAFGV